MAHHFGKHYIMIEANPLSVKILQERWYYTDFVNKYVQDMKDHLLIMPSAVTPSYQILSFAVGDVSGGQPDMCLTEPSIK